MLFVHYGFWVTGVNLFGNTSLKAFVHNALLTYLYVRYNALHFFHK